MAMKEVKPEEFNESVFRVIGKEWLLVTGEAEGKSNAMTVSWGGMGIMWGKPVAFIFIRPSRYTKEFIDKAEGLTLSVFTEDRREMMSYFGTVSGRDEDKIAKASLTVQHDNGRTYFDEARVTMLCRKLYAQEMQQACFIDKACDEKWYNDDYHTMYVVEIEKILVQD
ncbi:NADH-FMN oxidoreductase RutF, flavin reductase (DIM6/NTAB) family [Selenomonas sp. GACV-9]|uniref:flavin reductase family protein n=1 Tax=Selenomonas sp. GACV-9 TaxID=3158782 RepID=UPI0008E24027|nr:NADH-FMN oxidoreductase RutF, flavin reductase (DIM6/NTAB) family [Selenomonas ruminantium]